MRGASGRAHDPVDAGDDDGNRFVDPGYVRERWTGAGFEVCDHLPGGLRGWQDVVVLRRLGG